MKIKNFKTIIVFLIANTIIVSCGNRFKDQEGNVFKAIEIGDQILMAENLNVSYFRNGDPIFEAMTDEDWVKAGEEKRPAWSYYDNNPENGEIYGKLYNWYAVIDPRGLAPEGWHIPSESEWLELIDFIGLEMAGGKMKALGTLDEGTGLWYSPNTCANNESGFTGLPGGFRLYTGRFLYIGYLGYWWSSTEDIAPNALQLYLFYGDCKAVIDYDYRQNGLSIRAIKD